MGASGGVTRPVKGVLTMKVAVPAPVLAALEVAQAVFVLTIGEPENAAAMNEYAGAYANAFGMEALAA